MPLDAMHLCQSHTDAKVSHRYNIFAQIQEQLLNCLQMCVKCESILKLQLYLTDIDINNKML